MKKVSRYVCVKKVSRYVCVKKVSVVFFGDFVYCSCDGNVGEALKAQEERLCNEVEALTKFSFIGNMVSSSGGCESAATPG